MICTGELYWRFAKDVIESAKTNLLQGHEVDYLLWTDLPKTVDESVKEKVFNTYFQARYPNGILESDASAVQAEVEANLQTTLESINMLNSRSDITIFPTEHTHWPYPTLMRYHLFLQQEEKLREYDYLFYCDVDMLFVDKVGEEILGSGLTAALHPMYSLRKGLQFPLEPNPQSAAYIKVPQYYFAGGFQGGKTEDFITAMRSMKRTIDADFNINYLARWNDESHWNRYLFDTPPSVILDQCYVFPDSLIEEYYKKIWDPAVDWKPKLVTLTKKFSTSKEAGAQIKQNLESI